MFQYQNKVNAGVPQVCTPEIWDSLIDSPAVANTCAAIAALDPNAADYADRKQALKKRLPIIIPHAASFKNGKRVSADAIPSGLAMLDVDHVDNPREAYLRLLPEGKSEEWFVENGIYLIAITASGHGLRVIGRRNSLPFREGAGLGSLESIEAAQLRIATALGIKEYDAVTKDLARASYVVPRDYILWIDEDGLFSSSIASGFNLDNGSPEPHPSAGSTLAAIPASEKSPLLALPPHVAPSSVSPEIIVVYLKYLLYLCTRFNIYVWSKTA